MNVPRPSRNVCHAATDDVFGRHAGDLFAAQKDLALRAHHAPHIARNVVVLPAPLAPSSAVTPPSSTRKIDTVQHLRLAIGGVQASGLQAAPAWASSSCVSPR